METHEFWKIDAERSTLTFSIRHAALGHIKGAFSCWGGEVRIDPDKPQGAVVRIWVELSSLETGSRRRDKAIFHTELFDQRWEPALEFDGDSLEVHANDRMTVAGWLGLHSLRERIVVQLEPCLLNIDQSGSRRFVCTATASVDRRGLGLRKPRGVHSWLSDRLLGETIEVTAHVEATSDLPLAIHGTRADLGLRRQALAPDRAS
jgi:polyisoprenoid-binding protein YceI